MDPGIYIGVDGNIIQEERLNTITNNLANINTPGFKKDRVSFKQYLTSAIANTQTDISPGTIHQTGNPFDVAIRGNGFFTIQTPQGTAFTRGGNFTLNKDKQLVTMNGYPVLGEKGPIVINGSKLVINNEGTVFVDGKIIDKLKIASFSQPKLRRLGGNLLVPATGVSVAPAKNIEVLQGYLEESNVNTVKEMVKMIDVLRNYEISQKAIKCFDEIDQQAINNVANVRV